MKPKRKRVKAKLPPAFNLVWVVVSDHPDWWVSYMFTSREKARNEARAHGWRVLPARIVAR